MDALIKKANNRLRHTALLGAIAGLMSAMTLAEPPSYVGFESGAVRPMAMSADNKYLYSVNTPDGRLEIFNIAADGSLKAAASVPVGVEPVSVAVHGDEVWVVNHISDSVSVVDVSTNLPAVTRTLLVGDEPRDIVFANGRAFITTAHRGQHRSHRSLRNVPGAGDPQLTTPSISRADVWVFNANNKGGTALGGRPVKIVELFTDTPRALTVSPDGSTVYAAAFSSGNQTTAIHEGVVCDGFVDDEYGNKPCKTEDKVSMPGGLSDNQLPGGRPLPSTNAKGEPAPYASLIVKFDEEDGVWKDTDGRNWNNAVRFSLPDLDVFAIDADTLEEIASYPHAGTTLFNMATNPVNGNIYVTNIEANNATRFEGPGIMGGTTTQGEIAYSQITVINPESGEVTQHHLNSHIDYNARPAAVNTKQHTLSNPLDLVVSSDGSTIYTAAMGSNKIGVIDTVALESGAFNPLQASSSYIPVSGGGPVGVLLNEQANRLYVATRYDNGISVIDTNNGEELAHLRMYNPEPESVTAGRFMLYDADATSSNGESSCASCHLFGDADQLAWNLGNPDGGNSYNPQPIKLENTIGIECDYIGENDPGCLFATYLLNGNGEARDFASMKGPMTTQTLKAGRNHGHMHWRGDRSNGYFGVDNEQTLNAKTSFKNFIVAYEGLVGLDVKLPENSQASGKSAQVIQLEEDVDKFADFMLQTMIPPNPVRKLNNGLSPMAQRGSNFFSGSRRSDGFAEDFPENGPEADGFTCEGCHTLDPAKGFFGTDGEQGFTSEIQMTKTPHLRNMYTKVGMFGLPDRRGFGNSQSKQNQGPQVRGFGALHDGATDTFFNFLSGSVFANDTGTGTGIPNDTVRRELEQYMFEFENDVAPIVGQQITLNAQATRGMRNRLNLLESRARTNFVSKELGGQVKECDLVAQGVVGTLQVGYLFRPTQNAYLSDAFSESPKTPSQLHELTRQGENQLTFTCVVPGSGYRVALDRDLDQKLNRDDSQPTVANAP